MMVVKDDAAKDSKIGGPGLSQETQAISYTIDVMNWGIKS